jgi:hypothetical protein
MGLEVGDLVLYCGRQAEILSTGGYSNPWVVEVTDAGGLTHDYTVQHPRDLTPMIGKGETVLDALARIEQQELPGHVRLGRLAEQWAAAPHAGDVFRVGMGGPGAMVLELTEIREDGLIIGYYHDLKTNKRQHVTWDNDRRFRKFFESNFVPVYYLSAYATQRPDAPGHELLWRWPQ